MTRRSSYIRTGIVFAIVCVVITGVLLFIFVRNNSEIKLVEAQTDQSNLADYEFDNSTGFLAASSSKSNDQMSFARMANNALVNTITPNSLPIPSPTPLTSPIYDGTQNSYSLLVNENFYYPTRPLLISEFTTNKLPSTEFISLAKDSTYYRYFMGASPDSKYLIFTKSITNTSKAIIELQEVSSKAFKANILIENFVSLAVGNDGLVAALTNTGNIVVYKQVKGAWVLTKTITNSKLLENSSDGLIYKQIVGKISDDGKWIAVGIGAGNNDYLNYYIVNLESGLLLNFNEFQAPNAGNAPPQTLTGRKAIAGWKNNKLLAALDLTFYEFDPVTKIVATLTTLGGVNPVGECVTKRYIDSIAMNLTKTHISYTTLCKTTSAEKYKSFSYTVSTKQSTLLLETGIGGLIPGSITITNSLSPDGRFLPVYTQTIASGPGQYYYDTKTKTFNKNHLMNVPGYWIQKQPTFNVIH